MASHLLRRTFALCASLLPLLRPRSFIVAAAAPIRVNYGYFAEASPVRVACARGWLSALDPSYEVACYPQATGVYAASRLDGGSLHLAELGSTPLALAAARGVDLRVAYITHYKGDSQGVYVRPSDDDAPDGGYVGVEHPFDLVGRTMGVPFGSTMHYQALFLLDILSMTGRVELRNLSPTEIMRAWDDGTIDAAACWGAAREHVLARGADGRRQGRTLFSAGVLADWGRPTFNVVAVNGAFAEDHGAFVRGLVSVLGLLTDSFVDRIGALDDENSRRWTPTLNASWSYLPSVADALMAPGEVPGGPSSGFVVEQRRALDLYVHLTSREQASCDYLGPGPGGDCGRPSLQHVAIRKTAQFLMEQKLIHSMGRLAVMGDGGESPCRDPDTLCGGDLLDGSALDAPPGSFRLDAWDAVPPFYARNEIGRAPEGGFSVEDSDCGGVKRLQAQATRAYFADSASAPFLYEDVPLVGRSYSDNLDCWWVIEHKYGGVVDLSFSRVRVWSGDYIRVYSDPSRECSPDSETKVLLGQITGLDPAMPNFRAGGCILVQFETDANEERTYNSVNNLGDGFSASYTYAHPLLGGDESFECSGRRRGYDCSFAEHCLGTSRLVLDGPNAKHIISDSNAHESDAFDRYRYPNELDCRWEVEARGGNYVVLELDHYDVEAAYDHLQLYVGTLGSGATPYAVLPGGSIGKYYIPTNDAGFATIRFVTDSLGRRSGFVGSVYTSNESRLVGKNCLPGTSGRQCEIPHCIAKNSAERAMGSSLSGVDPYYQIGRVVSQIAAMSIPVNSNCTWTFGVSGCSEQEERIRLRFNSPLDLEPQPVSAIGDKLVVAAQGNVVTEVFVEKCDTDDVCSYHWQTGKCDDGACAVRPSIDVNTGCTSNSQIHIVTDRSDGDEEYSGVDFDLLFVSSCPDGADASCESGAGKCVDGACICNGGIPCSCPCDGTGVVSKLDKALLWALVPVVVVFASIFIWYRRRKIRTSREQKAIIQEKEEQLDAFRNSVVGMRSATTHYMPKPIEDSDVVLPPPREKIQWCWKETLNMMDHHGPDDVVGNPVDCWIKYNAGMNTMIENAFQASSKNEDKSRSFARAGSNLIESLKNTFNASSPQQSNEWFAVHQDGYIIDVHHMKQTKVATGFKRDIQRVTIPEEEDAAPDAPGQTSKDNYGIDMSEVKVGFSLPNELNGEPQMVLVKGDVIQISSQRQDGWAFGTKLHHDDEATARDLLRLTSKGSVDTNIFTDTGWFPLDTTEIPSAEELALLQTKVGGTDALQAPQFWDDIVDPTVVQLHKLKKSDKEYDNVVKSFLQTLKPPKFTKRVEVVSVERIQNLAMWQSYVVKRQTICYRETGQDGIDSPGVMKRALDRFERHWLWHGTNVEVMDKIMQQGFNRSFCGKNATVYGKGVYFARDAEYSAYHAYAVPDKNNVQYMMACRVTVGEYCPGVRNALTPDIRDQSTQTLYDATVGLLSNDTMANPSIYVTYHDAQAYPEYLIKFKQS